MNPKQRGASEPVLIKENSVPESASRKPPSVTKVGLTTAERFLLDNACRPVRRAFGHGPYLVGTATTGRDFRDVDVRTILTDDEFDALFAGRERLWDLFCASVSGYLTRASGLPIDYQVQRMTEANAKHGDRPRHPLGMNAEPADRFAGGGDATPDAHQYADGCDCRLCVRVRIEDME